MNKNAIRHIKVDDDLWEELHLLKLYLKKRSINDLLKQIIKEWKEIKAISVRIIVDRGA